MAVFSRVKSWNGASNQAVVNSSTNYELTNNTTLLNQIFNGSPNAVTGINLGTFLFGQNGTQFTMNNPLVIAPVSNQLLLGSQGGVDYITITAPTPTGNWIYTIPDAGANSTFLLGKQALKARTRTGLTTFSTSPYTTPSGVLYLFIRMVGGGGGGGSGGTTAVVGGVGTGGGATTFGTGPLFTCNGGSGGHAGGSGNTAAGGTASGSGSYDIQGGSGGYGPGATGTTIAVYNNYAGGGMGAASPFGGAGGGATNAAGQSATADSGSGGGGGGVGDAGVGNITQGGGGGGAGGYLEAIITSPAASYTFTVGASGAGNAAPGTDGFNGGAGGSGYILIDEFYQ
jgi:hypothetical protein